MDPWLTTAKGAEDPVRRQRLADDQPRRPCRERTGNRPGRRAVAVRRPGLPAARRRIALRASGHRRQPLGRTRKAARDADARLSRRARQRRVPAHALRLNGVQHVLEVARVQVLRRVAGAVHEACHGVGLMDFLRPVGGGLDGRRDSACGRLGRRRGILGGRRADASAGGGASGAGALGGGVLDRRCRRSGLGSGGRPAAAVRRPRPARLAVAGARVPAAEVAGRPAEAASERRQARRAAGHQVRARRQGRCAGSRRTVRVRRPARHRGPGRPAPVRRRRSAGPGWPGSPTWRTRRRRGRPRCLARTAARRGSRCRC